MKAIKYVHKSFDEAEDTVEFLNSISGLNHTLEGVWGTPTGVHVLLVFWDKESIIKYGELYG